MCRNQIDLSRKLDDLNFTLEFTVRTLSFHTGPCSALLGEDQNEARHDRNIDKVGLYWG